MVSVFLGEPNFESDPKLSPLHDAQNHNNNMGIVSSVALSVQQSVNRRRKKPPAVRFMHLSLTSGNRYLFALLKPKNAAIMQLDRQGGPF